jgi:CHAD domain-containing protein
MATTVEVERKYDIPADFQLPELASVDGVVGVGEASEYELDATYYDTADLRLAERRVTLRRRRGGHDDGWHLKRPAGADRTETRQGLTRGRSVVPAGLATQVRALTRGRPLEPVARIRTQRREQPVYGADAAVLALIAHDSVTSESFAQPPVSRHWRELEIELVGGDRDLLDRLDGLVRQAGANPSQSASKFAYALADRFPAGRPAPHGGTEAGRAIMAYLAAQRDAVLQTDPLVRAGDPDGVHDMRVALRRLRTVLASCRPFLDQDRTEPLRAELAWLATRLGQVRDQDVLRQRLADAAAAAPRDLVPPETGLDIRNRLTGDSGPARADLRQALDSPRYLSLLDAIDALVDAPAPEVSRSALRKRIRHELSRADTRMTAALQWPIRDGGHELADRQEADAALHDARRAVKRARYAVELIAPLTGGAGRLTTRLRALQDVLGAHHDAVVAREVLRDLAAHARAEGIDVFGYGALAGGQADLAGHLRAAAPAAYRKVTRRSVRKFLS